MIIEVAKNLAVTNGVDQYSAAFPMSDNNSVRAQINLAGNTATSLTVNIQGSSDLSNWVDGTSDTGFVYGSAATATRAIAFAYARLKFVVVGTGTVFVGSAVANTSKQ